jgi:hypothetical protein
MYLNGAFNQFSFQNTKGKRKEGHMMARESGEVSTIWKEAITAGKDESVCN